MKLAHDSDPSRRLVAMLAELLGHPEALAMFRDHRQGASLRTLGDTYGTTHTAAARIVKRTAALLDKHGLADLFGDEPTLPKTKRRTVTFTPGLHDRHDASASVLADLVEREDDGERIL